MNVDVMVEALRKIARGNAQNGRPLQAILCRELARRALVACEIDWSATVEGAGPAAVDFRQRRTRLGLTQRELARRARMHQGEVSAVEIGSAISDDRRDRLLATLIVLERIAAERITAERIAAPQHAIDGDSVLPISLPRT